MSVPISIKKCMNIELKTKKNVETICPCALVKYQLELKNTGSFTENYLVGINKPFKKWAKLAAEKITLAPGQETILDFYVRPGCGVYGNYSSIFKIIAEKTNLAAKMPLYLFILPCYDYEIVPGHYYPTDEDDVFLFREHHKDYELCEKEERTIPILIENKAPIPNRYDLKLRATKWAELEKTKIIINAENSTIVDLITKIPENLKENYTFMVEVETYWGAIKQKKEFNVSVDLCYTPFIKTDQTTVNYTSSTRQIEIQNLGSKKADYYFEIIEKPDWVNVEQLNITLLPNETKTINLISEPAEEIRQGNYNLVINTTAQNGVDYEDVIVIKLRKKGVLSKAYEKTKELVKDYIWYFLGGVAGLVVLLVVIFLIRRTLIERKELRKIEEKKEPEIKEEVKEKPKKEIKKPKTRLWKYLAAFVVVLLVLFAFSYTLIPEVFKGNFTAITTLYPGYSEEEINVTEVPVEEPEAEVLNATAPRLKPVLIKIKEKTYTYGKGLVNILKSYSYYIGFGILALILLMIIIRFVRKKKHEEAGIEEKIKEKPLKEKKKEVKKAAKKKVKKKTGFYHILKILLLALVAAILIFAISYFRNYIMYFVNYIIAGVAALVLLILIITLSKNKKAKKHFKKKWKSYFLVLVLILFLFGIYMSYKNKYYEGPYNKTKEWFSEVNSKLKNMTFVPLVENVTEEIEEEEEIKEIEEEEIVEEEIGEEVIEEEEKPVEEIEGAVISWDQNSDYTLDLKNYFHDPDNDKLYFSSSALKNIEIEVNDEGIAVMNPRKNWYGREKVIFTADDNKGGIVKSDEITLVVKEAEDQTYLTDLLAKTKIFFSLYSYYIVTGIVVLVAALFLLRIFEGKDNNKNKRKNRKNKKSKL